MMNKLKSMLQEKEKTKQDVEGEIHALKAAISKIRNLESMEREFNRVKARADENEELVARWNRFWYEHNNENGEGDDMPNKCLNDDEIHDASHSLAVHHAPDGDSENDPSHVEDHTNDGNKPFKRSRKSTE